MSPRRHTVKRTSGAQLYSWRNQPATLQYSGQAARDPTPRPPYGNQEYYTRRGRAYRAPDTIQQPVPSLDDTHTP